MQLIDSNSDAWLDRSATPPLRRRTALWLAILLAMISASIFVPQIDWTPKKHKKRPAVPVSTPAPADAASTRR